MKQWPTFDDDEDAAIATKSGKVKASNHTVYMPNRSSKKRKLNKEVMPEDSSNNRKNINFLVIYNTKYFLYISNH